MYQLPPHSTPGIAQLRLVHLALVTGPLLLGGVAVYVTLQGLLPGQGEDAVRVMSWIGVASAAVMVPLAAAVRRRLLARSAQGDDRRRRAAYAQSHLLFVALLEGAVLLNLVLVLATGRIMPYLAVSAALWALMVAAVPSEERFQDLWR